MNQSAKGVGIPRSLAAPLGDSRLSMPADREGQRVGPRAAVDQAGGQSWTGRERHRVGTIAPGGGVLDDRPETAARAESHARAGNRRVHVAWRRWTAAADGQGP